MSKYCLIIGLLLITLGCAGTSVTGNANTPIIKKPNILVPTERCLASNPKDVHIWINRMPGTGSSNRSSLHTAFTVTTGTPGYQFALQVNRVMESSPEQVVLDLVVTSPTGMVIQVVTENKVNIKLDGFPGSEGSSVQVNCGGKSFFKVDKVMAVH